MAEYSLPKPLNMIHGKPSIAYCLQNLPAHVRTLHFVVAPHLASYNFEEVVRNQFKERLCVFHWIPYFTRGPVETAWLGTGTLPESGEAVVFLDNDVVYNFPPSFFIDQHKTAFLGYAKDASGSEAFSFLTLNEEGDVVNFKEKKRISDNFCCGVYGFTCIRQFRDASFAVLNEERTTELYMSSLFQEFLAKGVPIKGLLFDGDVHHIGSLRELQDSWDRLDRKPMRVCFDLDNTLVTYPVTPGDYSTVLPVKHMVELARKMKSEGHTIIIYTARRMETHKCNLGAVIRDIGALTLKTLADFDIPFDEILFGKPIADMYIDDRAVNPFRDSVESMGYLHPVELKPLNMLATNKYNRIILKGDRITKSGPTQFLRGEIHFYESIPHETAVSAYFPRFFGAVRGAVTSQIVLEHVKAIPLYTLFKQELSTERHVLQIFEFMDMLHHLPGPVPTVADMRANCIDKLRNRFEVAGDYPFPDAREVQEQCLQGLATYAPKGVVYIHGDLWLSNILVDFTGGLKMIDMKGQVNSVCTTGGDPLYDYGKLYQSFLGYDAVLYNESISEPFRLKMTGFFVRESEKRGVSLTSLRAMTKALVIGTFHAIEALDTKLRVWDFLKVI